MAVCDEVHGKLVYDVKEQIRFPSEREGENIDCSFVRNDIFYSWMENKKGIWRHISGKLCYAGESVGAIYNVSTPTQVALTAV